MKKDFQGRQFMAVHDVRGALVSAAATLTTGTASTLIAGDSDYFLDIVEASFANASSAAAQVLLASDGTTIRTVQVPAASTLHLKFDVPLRQQTKGTPWVADMEDITGTSMTVEAILIKKPFNNS